MSLNQVDTSEETVNRDWDRIESQYKLKPEPQPEPKAAEQAANDDPLNDQRSAEEVFQSLGADEKKLLTQATVVQGTRFATKVLGKVDLPQDVLDTFGGSYAELLLKYFPKMSLLGLVEKYKVEIGAATATYGLYMAIKAAKAQQLKDLQAANDDTHKQEQAA